jgi:hypothetical protein
MRFFTTELNKFKQLKHEYTVKSNHYITGIIYITNYYSAVLHTIYFLL